MLQRCSLCFARAVQLDTDTFEHSRQIVRDLRVPKSDYAIALAFKPKLPLSIAVRCGVLVVMSAVEFDDQALGRTEEVHDIRTDGCLPPEVCAVSRKLLQRTPKDAFVRRRIRTQSFGSSPADRC